MTTQLEINDNQTTLYDRDYCQWLTRTAELLKKKEFTQLDLKNLIEEIESLGKSEKRAIESNLIVVILHLLKWQYQPSMRSNSWKSSIREHRRRVQRLLTDSPSLKNHLLFALADCYLAAKKQAADETGLSAVVFPEECLSLAEFLDEDFLPD
ncbi:MAG TPA: DUF29 domain-containing protein [Coleofasciculaceae cyanobacterium]|jgi:uncharacterized glyoxalase superfamily metalloenzyme YdcJ